MNKLHFISTYNTMILMNPILFQQEKYRIWIEWCATLQRNGLLKKGVFHVFHPFVDIEQPKNDV